LLFDLNETGPSDAKTTTEGGQTKSACSNAPSPGGTVTGTIPGNITLLLDENCTYGTATQPCEFLGNLTINGGSASINNCTVDGNITVITGSLSLANSTVGLTPTSGNVNISPLGSFDIGPQSLINGNLTIQNLPAAPSGIGTYTVCSSSINGNLSVLSNQAAIQIGTGGPTCTSTGNKIGGNLTCSGNANVVSGGNTVGGRFLPTGSAGQCKS
jgi:hypothetical protein